MTGTVTVFVRLMGGAFPGAIEGDIRVFDGAIPTQPARPGWIVFAEVPVQTIVVTTTTDDEGDTTT